MILSLPRLHRCVDLPLRHPWSSRRSMPAPTPRIKLRVAIWFGSPDGPFPVANLPTEWSGGASLRQKNIAKRSLLILRPIQSLGVIPPNAANYAFVTYPLASTDITPVIRLVESGYPFPPRTSPSSGRSGSAMVSIRLR